MCAIIFKGDRMTNIKKIFKKLIKRKNKKYYEASDVLTIKEKQLLSLTTLIVTIPLLVGLVIYIIG